MAFTYIPNEAIDQMNDLSAGAWRLYCYLCRCRNQKTKQCNPTVQTTAQMIGLHEKSVFGLRREMILHDWARFEGNSVTWLKYFDPDEEMPESTTRGFVYVFSDGADHYKIGRAKDVEDRRKTLSTGLPYDLEVVFFYEAENASQEEKTLHAMFSAKRLRAEWFSLSETDLAAIRQYANKSEKPDPPSEKPDLSESEKSYQQPEKHNQQSEESYPQSEKPSAHVRKNRRIEQTNRTDELEQVGATAPDIRSSHVAIQTCRGVANRYPPKAIWDKLIQVLGDCPDRVLLVECHAEWVERGYNAASWKWATEWYLTGVPRRISPEAKKQNPNAYVGKNKPTAEEPMPEEMAEYVETAILANDLVYLAKLRDEILKRGVKEDWEKRVLTLFERPISGSEPVTPAEMADLNKRIASLQPTTRAG